jgi:hypothetical protein
MQIDTHSMTNVHIVQLHLELIQKIQVNFFGNYWGMWLEKNKNNYIQKLQTTVMKGT